LGDLALAYLTSVLATVRRHPGRTFAVVDAEFRPQLAHRSGSQKG